jgi:NOL1/NOP2/fmu family ribosome biogenesis protein
MFRKSDEALSEWSEENVLACAERQKQILDNVAGTVKGGGKLLYSTCTYSLEENEYVVDYFLKKHPDFHLVRVKPEVQRRTSDGIRPPDITAENIEYTRRVYPHVLDGEGQYIALFERADDGEMSTILYKDAATPLNKKESAVIEKFFRDALAEKPDGRLAKYGENIVLISHGLPVPPRSVFMAGVLVGEISGEIFKPSHQFFSVYGGLFKSQLHLMNGDPRTDDYLLGREIDAEGCQGYTAVIYEGATLGGGKASGGRLKNHYPKGLRNKG